MKRALQSLAWVLGGSILLLMGCIAMDQIPMAKARPPRGVTDVDSFLAWIDNPMGAYRVTFGDKVYYQITGPAGRYIASGPSAYTFDSQGRFIGWTADMGDFKRPVEVFQKGANRERVPIDQLPKKR